MSTRSVKVSFLYSEHQNKTESCETFTCSFVWYSYLWNGNRERKWSFLVDEYLSYIWAKGQYDTSYCRCLFLIKSWKHQICWLLWQISSSTSWVPVLSKLRAQPYHLCQLRKRIRRWCSSNGRQDEEGVVRLVANTTQFCWHPANKRTLDKELYFSVFHFSNCYIFLLHR